MVILSMLRNNAVNELVYVIEVSQLWNVVLKSTWGCCTYHNVSRFVYNVPRFVKCIINAWECKILKMRQGRIMSIAHHSGTNTI